MGKRKPSDLRTLLAACRRLLEAYEEERQAVFECVSLKDGSIPDPTGQWLVSLMDANIAATRAALTPFLSAGPAGPQAARGAIGPGAKNFTKLAEAVEIEALGASEVAP